MAGVEQTTVAPPSKGPDADGNGTGGVQMRGQEQG
jgi:hypothetical protein